MNKRAGFSVVEVAIVVVVIVIVGAIGWMAYTNIVAPKNDTASESSKTNDQVTVEKESDLDKVNKELDDITLEDADNTQFDAALETF